MAPHKILVIDDNLSDFDVIEALLLRENYELTYADGGQAAIAQLETWQPDVIISDLLMQNMTGIEVCQHIKANRRLQHIPIIMVTSLDSDKELVRCLEAGADDFISKPLNGIKLRARLKSMLRIKQQYDALQTALTRREDITQVIVHDLRNPITRLLLACNMLSDMDLPERPAQKVTQIAAAIQELRNLVEDILVTAKLETGQLTLHITDVDIRNIATAVLSNFAPLAATRRIELVADLPTVCQTIPIDATLMRRVLDILLAHTLKFSPKDSRVTFTIQYPQDVNYRVRILIADESAGFSAAKRRSIFEKYEVGEVHRDVMEIGLGLSFCKMAIDAHRGSIFVSDNHPSGSIFTIEI